MTLLLPYEVWRDIKGYEGLYQISASGRVKSLVRVVIEKNVKRKVYKERTIGYMRKKDGYCGVDLKKNGIRERYLVHRLVAIHFMPNIENKSNINHIDGRTSNNDIANLEWCNQTENAVHAVNILNRNCRNIAQYDSNGVFVRYWQSATQAAKELGIVFQGINRVCTGERRSYKGFIWKYA